MIGTYVTDHIMIHFIFILQYSVPLLFISANDFFKIGIPKDNYTKFNKVNHEYDVLVIVVYE